MESNKQICKQKVHKHPFTVEEDRALMNYVMIYGCSNWVQIASLMKGRTQKQCRERWNGHLCPSVNKGPWTLEEDLILAQKHSEIGNKWAKISHFLPGRTDILVKNRWNTSVKYRVMNGELNIPQNSSPSNIGHENTNQNIQKRQSTCILPSVFKPADSLDIETWLGVMSQRTSCLAPAILVNQPQN